MKKISIILLSILINCDVISPQKKEQSTELLAIALLLQSSLSNASTGSNTDASLYQESVATSNLSIFPNTPSTAFNSLLSDRAHGNSIIMRVNAIAKNSIDATNKAPIGGSFTEGSLIVKERYSSGNLVQIISMKKVIGFTSGWAWGEYSPTGSVQYSIRLNGSGCISCHLKGKDYVRIFEY